MNSSAPKEMKPCPFCGGEAERYDDGDTGSFNFGMSCITCKRCGASSPMHGDRKENLVDSWNTRQVASVERAELDHLMKMAVINSSEHAYDIERAEVAGEAVAWLYESWNGGDSWGKHFSFDKPAGNQWQRNIVPLYASPPRSEDN